MSVLCLLVTETRVLGVEGDPVLEEVGEGQDVTQLGDVSSCYGDLYFCFWDDRPSKSQDLAK